MRPQYSTIRGFCFAITGSRFASAALADSQKSQFWCAKWVLKSVEIGQKGLCYYRESQESKKDFAITNTSHKYIKLIDGYKGGNREMHRALNIWQMD